MDRKKANEWGSDLIRTRISREPFVLERRTWRDFKFWEWIFIVCALISVFVSVGFCTFQLVVALIDKENRYIFPVLIIINNLFSVYFLWNGVLEELPFKLLVQLVIKTIIWVFDLIYFLIPYAEISSGRESESDTGREIRDIRFYISSSLLFLTVVSGVFVIYQYWTSNIAIFRSVGTEPKYVRLYRQWNLSYSILLLDAVIFITVVFHLCNFPEFLENYSAYYLVPLWVIATVAYVLLGTFALERESRLLTYAFYVASHFQPIFVIFMLVKATRSSLGLLLYISLFTTSMLSLLTHIVLLITVVRCQNSFGRGLKQAAAKEVERKQLLTTFDGGISHRTNNVLQQSNVGGNSLPPTETEL